MHTLAAQLTIALFQCHAAKGTRDDTVTVSKDNTVRVTKDVAPRSLFFAPWTLEVMADSAKRGAAGSQAKGKRWSFSSWRVRAYRRALLRKS